jgi:hypothetical protein
MDGSCGHDQSLLGRENNQDMSDKPTGISGTRRQIRELVDGSLEVRIHIDPRFKKAFHELFPEIDTPVAIAPLVNDFERLPQPDKPKGGPLCTLAARWCKEPMFQQWVGVDNEQEAAASIRTICEIKSRSELDHNPMAAFNFNDHFRTPYMDFLKTQLERE